MAGPQVTVGRRCERWQRFIGCAALPCRDFQKVYIGHEAPRSFLRKGHGPGGSALRSATRMLSQRAPHPLPTGPGSTPAGLDGGWPQTQALSAWLPQTTSLPLLADTAAPHAPTL